MRKILWIIPLFLAAIGTPSAHADEYVNGSFDDGAFTIVPNGTIQVSTALGQGITAADITIDSSLGVAVFDAPAIFYTCEPLGYNLPGQGCTNGFSDDPSLSTVSATLVIGYFENGAVVPGTTNGSVTEAGVDYAADGNFTITESPVETPEPPTGILLLAGVGLLIVTTRKRIGKGLPQSN